MLDFEKAIGVKLNHSYTTLDEETDRMYLHLSYTFFDKEGNKHELIIPKIKLPFRETELPKIISNEYPVGLRIRNVDYYIPTDDLPIERHDGIVTDYKGNEHPYKDVAYIDRIVEYAVKEMTQEEIEKELGYKVKIVSEKEDK